MTKNGLRIFKDDFTEKVKNIHDEMEKHHSYKKKRVQATLLNCLSKKTLVVNLAGGGFLFFPIFSLGAFT